MDRLRGQTTLISPDGSITRFGGGPSIKFKTFAQAWTLSMPGVDGSNAIATMQARTSSARASNSALERRGAARAAASPSGPAPLPFASPPHPGPDAGIPDAGQPDAGRLFLACKALRAFAAAARRCASCFSERAGFGSITAI
jgi:hypothetical protein